MVTFFLYLSILDETEADDDQISDGSSLSNKSQHFTSQALRTFIRASDCEIANELSRLGAFVLRDSNGEDVWRVLDPQYELRVIQAILHYSKVSHIDFEFLKLWKAPPI